VPFEGQAHQLDSSGCGHVRQPHQTAVGLLVEVVDGLLYVADGPGGVIALDLADCNVVLADGSESGDLSAWSGGSGALGASPSSR